MMLANTISLNPQLSLDTPVKKRRSLQGVEPAILSDIYQQDINIVTWKRDLSDSLKVSVSEFLVSKPTFKVVMTVSPQRVFSSIIEALGSTDQSELAENITELVNMYCCLFDLERVALRLTALNNAMCPKFHVDKVPCRLVTTYQGIATQWLPHQVVNRTKLGAGSNGLADHESGLYQHESDIQQLKCGDVGLLKGEYWPENEDAGLVHRSPTLTEGNCRLLLSLDFSD